MTFPRSLVDVRDSAPGRAAACRLPTPMLVLVQLQHAKRLLSVASPACSSRFPPIEKGGRNVLLHLYTAENMLFVVVGVVRECVLAGSLGGQTAGTNGKSDSCTGLSGCLEYLAHSF